MRVALAVDGSRGDVAPVLALGERLRAAGHTALVCATPDARPLVEARGFEFRPVGSDARAFLTEHAPALHGGVPAQMRATLRYLARCLRQQFDELPAATQDVDAIVGAGVQVAAASVAEAHGVPFHMMFYCPALLRSSAHAPASSPSQSARGWANRLNWWLLVRTANLFRGEINRRRAILGLGPARCAYEAVRGPARVLLATDPALAPLPGDIREEVAHVGYLHLAWSEPLPEKLEDFLAAGPPPVYLGFGSMPDARSDVTTRLLLEAADRTGVRLLISEGWAGLGRTPLPENAMAIGALDHAKLFPRCAAVVHHGGAGTTASAARAGVPQIVVPHMLDQVYWAERVRLLGLGVAAPSRRRLSSASLAAALCEVVENELLAERAAQIGARIREARCLDPVGYLTAAHGR